MPRKASPTQDQIIRERWLRGRLDYKLHAGQKLIQAKFDEFLSQLFVGECARQFGKTFLEAKLSLEKAFRKPRARIKIGTAFHTDLVEFLLPAFDAVMADCPDDLRPIYKSQKSKFIVPHTDSEIKLIGLDRKPNGLRGNVIDLIILSEAAFIKRLRYLYESIIIPATTHRPDCRIVMLTTPPPEDDHEFLEFVQRAQLLKSYCKFTVYDNPMLNENDIKRLMYESGGEDSSTWKREYLCQHVVDKNFAIIPEWDESKYVQEIPRDEYFQFYHKYVGMDLGVVRDKTAVLFGYYDFLKAQLIIEDEYTDVGTHLTTELIQQNIKRKENELWAEAKPHLRVSDNNNPLLLQDLSLIHKLHFIGTDKGRIEEMVNTVKTLVKQGGLIVHPRCKQLIGCLNWGVWDSKRDKFSEHKVYGHFDALAALIYLVRNLNRSLNPIPHDFRADRDNQIVFPHRKDSDSVRTLKTAFGIKGVA